MTPAARIPKYISELRSSILISVNGTPVSTVKDVTYIVISFKSILTTLRKPIELISFRSLKIPTHSRGNIPQLNIDQLAVIAKHHHTVRHALKTLTNLDHDNGEIPHSIIIQGIERGQLNPKLTMKFTKQQDNWDN